MIIIYHIVLLLVIKITHINTTSDNNRQGDYIFLCDNASCTIIFP